MLKLSLPLGASLLAAAVAGCLGGVGETRRELHVYAAPSLAGAFREIGDAFQTESMGVQVVNELDESSALRGRIEDRVRADVFATSDRREMERVIRAKLTVGQPVAFASDRLVLITPAREGPVSGAPDLARPGVRLVLAVVGTSAGEDARAALARMEGAAGVPLDFSRRALANVVGEEPSARQVVAKVAEGEADAGIVFLTDVTRNFTDRVRVRLFPASTVGTVTYSVIPLRHGEDYALAIEYLAFLVSPHGRTILGRHGFQEARP